MDSTRLTVLLSNDRWLFIEYFFGFVESVCVFYTSVYGSKACAALHLDHSSFSASFRHAHRYFFKFFCTQETPLHSPFVLIWCVLISLFRLPLYKLSTRTSSSQSAQCWSHDTQYHIFLPSFLRFISALPESSAVFSVFISSAHTLQRRSSVCSRRISLSVRSFPPLCEFMLPFRRTPDGAPQRRKLQHTRERFETHFWCGSLPWKPDWYKAQI